MTFSLLINMKMPTIVGIFSYLLAEKISCSAELSRKKVLYTRQIFFIRETIFLTYCLLVLRTKPVRKFYRFSVNPLFNSTSKLFWRNSFPWFIKRNIRSTDFINDNSTVIMKFDQQSGQTRISTDHIKLDLWWIGTPRKNITRAL